MAKYNKMEVALTMNKTGIVPVYYNSDYEVCKKVLKACYDGGLRIFEFTNRGDFAHEIFGELVKFAQKELEGMILGVGSVVEASTAALYIQLGANFIVSPIIDSETAKLCNRRGVAWSPGCGSGTEIIYAMELGADIVKLFPAKEVGGHSFIKNIKGPMPWLKIMPTGGVEPTYENLLQWFKADVWCVGMGSKLFPAEEIKKGNYNAVKQKAEETIELVKKIREELK